MKIISTAGLLGLTLISVPVFTYFFGTPLGDIEIQTLNILAWLTGGVILYCFVVGEWTNNNSQVDKLWSILPIVYAWIVAYQGSFDNRLTIMALLATVWGLRLTANFALKGAYSWKFWEGEEDYRWEILKQKPEFKPRWKWTLFNLFFICFYQNVLILMFTLPCLVALQYRGTAMGVWDYVVASVVLFFIVYETIADLQQWHYQNTKKAKIQSGQNLDGDYHKGFLDTGLWSFSRHPNYFAEQSIWVGFYLFSVTASGLWINWSLTGALLLIVLFQGSSQFSEEISASKYPEYAVYQKRVPRFMPDIGLFLKKHS